MKHLNTNSLNRGGRRRGAALTIALGLAFAAPAVQAEKAGAFEMLVYESSAKGQLLIQGEWEAAEAMEGSVSETRFAALNDRCVALTVARDLDRAEVVCNDAVRAARRSETSRSPGTVVDGDIRTNRAMALTNRGVLFAFQGEGEAAREDFERAVKLNTEIEAPVANLELLDARLATASAN